MKNEIENKYRFSKLLEQFIYITTNSFIKITWLQKMSQFLE